MRDQRFRARVVGLDDAEVRVVAGEAPAERVDAAAERRRGEVLARTRPSHRPPAQRAQVERERRPWRAPTACGRRRPTRVRRPWPPRPPRPAPPAAGAGSASASRRRGTRRGAARRSGAVAPDDHHATAPRGGGRVVDRDGQVGQPHPGVASRVVGVDAPRVRAAREEAAGDDDPSAERRCGDLGARLRKRASRTSTERRPGPRVRSAPGRRSPEPGDEQDHERDGGGEGHRDRVDDQQARQRRVRRPVPHGGIRVGRPPSTDSRRRAVM